MLADYQSFSFAHKLKSSICCFRSEQREFLDNADSPPKTPRSPCSWLRSTANEIPELRDRCRNLMARIGRGRRRYHNSADFSYDSSSYALNFEDESRDYDEFPLRDFTARLPASPPAIKERAPAAKYVGSHSVGARTITVCS